MINLLTGIDSTAAALTAERIRMDVVTQNIANANTMQGADGRPYQRQQVVFESVLSDHLQANRPGSTGVQTTLRARVEPDARPPRVVYDPQRGAIELPNINMHEEMADLIVASRAFEANLSVIKTARTMAVQTLAIGKR
jgi:flagellar basal-body rod protein FlgC